MPAAAPQAAGALPVPRHVAVIMDGNGRWAEQRSLPRAAGHRAGTHAVRTIIEECVRHGVGALTLFAFSSENWQRPAGEVGLLMQLFLESLDREVAELDANGVVVPGLLEALDHVVEHSVRERVALVRLIQGDRGDAAVHLVKNVLVHRTSAQPD